MTVFSSKIMRGYLIVGFVSLAPIQVSAVSEHMAECLNLIAEEHCSEITYLENVEEKWVVKKEATTPPTFYRLCVVNLARSIRDCECTRRTYDDWSFKKKLRYRYCKVRVDVTTCYQQQLTRVQKKIGELLMWLELAEDLIEKRVSRTVLVVRTVVRYTADADHEIGFQRPLLCI